MNIRQKIDLCLLLYIVLGSAAFAQVVDIPDPNLRAAIREALNLPNDSQVTVQDISQLTDLRAQNTGIENLDGLEYATNLRRLWVGSNPLSDLSPISNCSNLEDLDISGCGISDIFALQGLVNLLGVNLGVNSIHDLQPLEPLINLEHLLMYNNPVSNIVPLENLRKLKRLWAWHCQISDISALHHLSELTELNLVGNQIVDIAPLANLTQLTHLSIASNRIADVNPLASLIRLEWLEIQINNIADHSPLDSLSLDHFIYDQECNMPPFPLMSRLENKTYPSPYAAEWTYGIDPRLDLVLGYILGSFGLHHHNDGRVVGNMEYAIQKRGELMATNPNMVFLVNISMRSEAIDHYGEDWPFWIRDASGNIIPEGTKGHGFLDFTHSAVQDIIVEQAIAVSKCGLFDGIVFDWWHETGSILSDHNTGWREGYRGLDAEQRARDVILQRIRTETRPNFLIQVNSNRGKIPRTAPYINGLTMETGIPNWFTTDDARNNALLETESTLLWAEENLREPRINGVAGEALYGEAEDNPNNRRWARVLLTLSLTHADGYAVYQTHASWGKSTWIDLFEADLGHPVGPKSQLYDEDIPGLYIREFTNGWAVYNRSGQVQEITLPELATGVASGVEGTTHSLPNYDGEMYLRVKPKNPADANGDGAVNILDLVVVAQGLGTGKPEADVNGDGVVNVFDLVFVAGEIGGGGAAPSAYSLDPTIISAADVARWLTEAQGLGVGDANFQRGIRFLEGLLAALTPKETTLLPNFPNPFNPETWIPYRLAREAEVAITIYDAKGTPVRRLTLGNQAAGHYTERGKAAYWDGRNEEGEAVASGIYIYQFRAGDYAASRRMVIVK